jgi:hypothetical protein
MSFQPSAQLTLQLQETAQAQSVFVLFPDAQSNEIRVEVIKAVGQPITFDFTTPPDRSLITLTYLAEAFGLVNTAALLMAQGMSIQAAATALGAIGVNVQIN